MQSVDTDTSFVYNENGLRVRKTVNGVVTNYTLHGKNVVHMTQGSNELHFFYDTQNKSAIVVYNGVPYSYVKNLQGDVVALLNSTGAVVVSYVYDAWVRQIDCTFEAGNNAAEALSTLNPFRYRGYVYDEETGLYYLRSRYFNPTWNRFINADILLGKHTELFSHNSFCYCHNACVIQSDSHGHAPQETIKPRIDITSKLNEAMEKHYNELMRIRCEQSFVSAVFYFFEKVKTGGEWDLKAQEEWNLSPDNDYVYDGITLRYDEPGNIHFGYVGSALFGLGTLRIGAGFIKYFPEPVI